MALINRELSVEDAIRLIQDMRVDLDKFASVLIPTVATAAHPPIFASMFYDAIECINKVQAGERLKFEEGKFNWAIPRGFGKTTLMKLIAAYALIYTDVDFTWASCETDTKGKRFGTDVFSILTSANLNSLYRALGVSSILWSKQDANIKQGRGYSLGTFLDKLIETQDYAQATAYTLQNEQTKILVSAGCSIRGTNIDFVRPKLILTDDIQSLSENHHHGRKSS